MASGISFCANWADFRFNTVSTSLLIPEHPLQVLPLLATAIGLNEAIVLQQFQYLSRIGGRVIDGEKWVFDTYESLHEKFFPFWSIPTIQRTISSLEKSGWLLSCQPEGVMSRRKYYRISNQTRIHLTLEKLEEQFKTRKHQLDAMGVSDGGVPLTEIPKPENTEQKNKGQTPFGCSSFSDSSNASQIKPNKAVAPPPTWAEVEKHAKRQGIDLAAALRFFDVSQHNGWKTKTGPIRKWKCAMSGFIKAEPANAQKAEKVNSDDFWAWAESEFDDEEIENARAWAVECKKRGWNKINDITGQLEPINNYKSACRSFVEAAKGKGIIR